MAIETIDLTIAGTAITVNTPSGDADIKREAADDLQRGLGRFSEFIRDNRGLAADDTISLVITQTGIG